MLQKLQQVAQEGTIAIQYAYLSHIKKEDDRKILAHAETLLWEDMDPAVGAVLEKHLYQAIAGTVGEVNFPSFYTGEVLSVEKVASPEFDRTKNRPAVELLEAIRDQNTWKEESLIDLGNALSYKVMAAGAIKSHLIGILHFTMVPQMGAAPISFVFGTIVDLEDREESLFDEGAGKFRTQMLNNVIKKGNISRGVFFPCLDDEGRESADLLVYSASGGAAWFKALEAGLKLNPRREAKALVRMIAAEAVDGEVPHDLFRQMGEELLDEAADGLNAASVADSLEKAVGRGIDRARFQAGWETAFGDASYRPAYDGLFGSDAQEKPTKLKMQTGNIAITVTPSDLEHFRQVTVGKQTFILFEVPEQAKVVVGKDTNLAIKPVELEDLIAFLKGEAE